MELSSSDKYLILKHCAQVSDTKHGLTNAQASNTFLGIQTDIAHKSWDSQHLLLGFTQTFSRHLTNRGTDAEIPIRSHGIHTDTAKIVGLTDIQSYFMHGGHTDAPSLNSWSHTDTKDSLMGFTQTPVTNQLTSHSYLTLSHRVYTHLSKHWAHTCIDAHTVTWESHRHSHRSMGSPRYPHVLMGDTQKPLSKVWAHTDTHTFSRGSHRHPLTNDWAHTDTQHFLIGVT